MKYSIPFILLSILMQISCNKNAMQTIPENDTLRGMWGQVELYNALGNKISQGGDVIVAARCIDTIVSINSDPIVFDTTIFTLTNDKGIWGIENAPKGRYFIEFSKESFGTNALYNYAYDTSRADTLAVMHLSQKPFGSISLEHVSIKAQILDVARIIHFEHNSTELSMLSTWYFFDTTALVSPEQYVYAYVSGASVGQGGSSQTLTIQKPLEKIYQSGARSGQTIYVRAYIDNAKYIRYQQENKVWIYPNLTGASNVLQFVLPEE